MAALVLVQPNAQSSTEVETVLPKARLISALEHKEGDRVPVGELHADWDIVERALGHRTYVYSQWREWVAEWEGRRDEVVESYKRDLIDLARKFEWDFVVVPVVPARRQQYGMPEMLGGYTWRDGSGRVWRYSPETGGAAMLVEAPHLGIGDIGVPPEFQFDETCLEAVRHVVKELGGTHFVVGRPPDPTFPWRYMAGFADLLVRTVTEPEFFCKAVAACLPGAIAWVNAMCDLGVDGITMGVDYCDNRGPFMGPQLFRRLILPALGEVCRAVHARGKHFIKHCDGNTWSILDDFVEVGVDGWHGIQPSIGMDFKLLKERFAGRLCLFGGVNCDTLVSSTPAEVAKEVKYAIRHTASGGGLVLTSGNSLLVGTRYENYLAMLGAARDYGGYPSRLEDPTESPACADVEPSKQDQGAV